MRINIIVALCILLAGCFDKTTDKVAETKEGNQEVNCLEFNFGISDQKLIERLSEKNRKPDFTLLKKIHLPKNATLCQKRDFIEAILYLSSNQRSYIETDPQVKMIALGLKGNEQDFLSMAKPNWHSPNSYISDAYIEILSATKKKNFVKKNFREYPWLIEVITKNNWSNEFKNEIISYAEMNDGRLNYHFASAFVQINDPNTKELVLKSFVNSGGNRHIFYSRIESIDWLDPTPAMEGIWQSPNVENLELQYLAYPLGIKGFLPVLDYLANNPDGTTYDNPYRKNADFFNYLTDQQLEGKDIKTWFLQYRDLLEFDQNNKKFRVALNKSIHKGAANRACD